MDDEFERSLLRMIDALLAEPNPSGEQFHEFRRRINRFYSDEMTVATQSVFARYPDATLEDWIGTSQARQELDQGANEQLPRVRRELFQEMKERWDWTGSWEPADLERQYGWRSLGDLLPFLQDKRGEYKRRFGC